MTGSLTGDQDVDGIIEDRTKRRMRLFQAGGDGERESLPREHTNAGR